MFIQIGYGKKLKDDMWLGTAQCPNCGRTADFRLKRVQMYANVLWIPVMSRTVKRVVVCENCGAGWEKTKAEYRELEAQQQMRLEQGAFPDRIVARDYAPASLHKGRKNGLLIAAILFLLMIFSAAAAVIQEIQEEGDVLDGGSTLALILVMAAGALPLIFALRGITKTARLEKIYNFYEARNRLRQQQSSFPKEMQEKR